MQPRSYYRIITDPQNNFVSMSADIQVNCTGYSVYQEQDTVYANSIRQDYYLLFLMEGTVSVVQPTLFRSLKPGDFIIFSPNTPFEYVKKLGEKMVYYWVHFTGKNTAFLLSQCQLSTNTILTPAYRNNIQDLFLRLFDAFSTRDHLFDLHAANILSLLLITFGRYIALLPTSEVRHAPRSFVQSISYIHDHLSEAISIRQLADMEFLSVSRYRALFKERMGISPQEYVIFTKLQHACRLLENTRMPISEISHAIGYDDPQYFSRLFTKHMGTSPSAYRKQ